MLLIILVLSCTTINIFGLCTNVHMYSVYLCPWISNDCIIALCMLLINVYLQLHTMALSELSSSRKPSRSRRQRSFSETNITPVHNYSTQTYNSIKLSKAKLRERLSVDPTHRYTYCQHYHSMTVVPIDVEAEQRAQRCVLYFWIN